MIRFPETPFFSTAGQILMCSMPSSTRRSEALGAKRGGTCGACAKKVSSPAAFSADVFMKLEAVRPQAPPGEAAAPSVPDSCASEIVAPPPVACWPSSASSMTAPSERTSLDSTYAETATCASSPQGSNAEEAVVEEVGGQEEAEEEFQAEEESVSAEWRLGKTQGDHLLLAKARRQSVNSCSEGSEMWAATLAATPAWDEIGIDSETGSLATASASACKKSKSRSGGSSPPPRWRSRWGRLHSRLQGCVASAMSSTGPAARRCRG